MSYNIDNTVTIDIELNKTKYKPKYTVVVGWSKEDVLKLASHNEDERIFTLPFYTGPVEDVPDWSGNYYFHYLVQPFYVKDIEDIPKLLKAWGFEDGHKE